MELAKLTSKGQITIPIDIRRKLGIKEGDKILFIEEAGRIYIINSSMEALKEAQAAFAGEAERVGLKNEDDVVAMMKEFRKKRAVEWYESDDGYQCSILHSFISKTTHERNDADYLN